LVLDQNGIEGLMRQGNWDDAMLACRSALQVQPTNAKMHAYLGLCQFQKQDWQGAAGSFQKATALQPDFWQAGAKLAQSLERMRRYPEALDVAREFARVQPNDITLQGLIRYLTPMVRNRVEGWERTAHLGIEVRLASELE
jgi:tetratricopeptide (TPR) repeat protein